jgi:hypothetical protein
MQVTIMAPAKKTSNSRFSATSTGESIALNVRVISSLLCNTLSDSGPTLSITTVQEAVPVSPVPSTHNVSWWRRLALPRRFNSSSSRAPLVPTPDAVHDGSVHTEVGSGAPPAAARMTWIQTAFGESTRTEVQCTGMAFVPVHQATLATRYTLIHIANNDCP